MSEASGFSWDTLYYDGLCPLCQKEIRLLQRIQRGGLTFVDVHQVSPEQDVPPRNAMLQVLHLRTEAGEWLKGVEATVRAWSHTRWGWMFRPLLWPCLNPLVGRVYQRWAERRYRRLYACSVCMGGED